MSFVKIKGENIQFKGYVFRMSKGKERSSVPEIEQAVFVSRYFDCEANGKERRVTIQFTKTIAFDNFKMLCPFCI